MPPQKIPTSRGGTGWVPRKPFAEEGNGGRRPGPRPPAPPPAKGGIGGFRQGGRRGFPPRVKREGPAPPSPGGKARGVRREASRAAASAGVLPGFGVGVSDQGA